MADSVMTEAMERFTLAEQGMAFNREAALRDIEFARLGVQWPAAVSRQRQDEGRPCLTINRMPAFIRQVVNDARQNKPSIKIAPVDRGGDVKTADVIAGLIRSIERVSNAGVAYDTAVDHQVTGGFGFFRISIDYAHEDSFDKEARIDRVPNPMSVQWDPRSNAYDASDWGFAFISEFVPKDEFKRMYPKAAEVSFESSYGADQNYWLQDDTVRVAEYFDRVEKRRKLLLLSDGRAVREELFTDEVRAMAAMMGVTIVDEREATYHEVIRRIMSGVEVLEEEQWPGSLIPICPVWGEEVIFEGRRHFRSLIRDARDPQSMFNFWRSASTELVALAPRAPWLVPVGGIPVGHEKEWQTANNRSHPFLMYDPNAGPMPQRQAFAGVPAGALQEALNAADDMKAIVGIYDSALGARSNETSGRAILARQRESDVSTFHFIDNLARAIQYAGRVLVEIIPSIYSKRQAIRIIGEDEAETIVNMGEPDENGKLYDLATGRYDVSVKVGPSYATQREEAREALLEIMNRIPGAAMVIGDLALSNMDFPQADEAAKRVQMLQQLEMQKMGLAPQPQPGAPPPVDQLQQSQGIADV